MSHVTKTGFTIYATDLDAVEEACRVTGTVEFMRGQTSYRWYGSFLNDSESGRRYAQEVSPEKWGRCDHAIRVKGNSEAYEIGLVRNAEGNFDLVFDSWGPGRAIIEACGEDLYRLRQNITATICEREMARESYRSVRSVDAEGRMIIEFEV